MDLGPFLIETHLRTGRPIAELARTHGVHRSWLYKLLRRHRLEGPAGLEARSRRPHRCPARRWDRYEDEIVTVRKELLDFGVDAGAETIRYHLQQRHDEVVPSVSTIWRVLKARGFVTPQPQKRPRSSLKRFCADLPNETWQADVTHVPLADGVVFEVLNIIDDHSRLCVASRAFVSTRSSDVVRTFYKAAETLGFPQSFLTDNGLIFTSQARHGFAGAFEMELAGLGVHSEALASLPSPDLREGRAIPPNAQEVHQRAGPHRDEETTPGPARSFRRLLQRRPTAPRRRPSDSRRGVRGKGEGSTVLRADRRERWPQAAPRQARRQGNGDAACRRQDAPHSLWPSVRPLASAGPGRGPRHLGDRCRRPAGATPHLGSDEGLPTPRAALSRSVYDVSRHVSPMSRDITVVAGGGFEPPTFGL